MAAVKVRMMQAVVPDDLADQAIAAAKRERPGVNLSGVIRLALARLAGLPDDRAEIPQGGQAHRQKETSAA
jgi:hypothetical protein